MPEVATPAGGVANRDRFFIGGKWVEPHGSGHIDVINPGTEEVLATIPEGSPEDAEAAVKAAADAFESWSQTPPAGRAEYLDKIKRGLAARADELQALMAAEVGMPVDLSPIYQLGSPPFVFGYYARLARDFEFEEEVGNSLIMREPVGVVAAITPWNYPLHQTIAKIAPALLAGCTVVHKPSEVAPLSAHVLAEIAEDIGLPAGVYNLVSGSGAVVGEALAQHPDVDMVSFTGSTRAGRRVSELASATVKRVALELGGKSANVILDDADITAAVKVGVANCFLNSGQTCTAWTRMLAPASRYDDVVALAAETAGAYTVGDPTDPATRLGPLASGAQRDRVLAYIGQGVAEGARLVAGGADGVPNRGYYVAPTVFADVASDATIAQEEIFGPVLSIIRCADDDDAVRIANATQYGLAGAVWSADTDRALAVARRLRTGQVDINGGRFNPSAPFGGYKQSGNGRELGRHGLEEFLLIKSLQLP
jgi:acyl-CoA reductase-like NAD-dependent aldehyde dehydrogenase